MSNILLSAIDNIVKEDRKAGDDSYMIINHYKGPLPMDPVLVTNDEYVKATNGDPIDNERL